MDEAAVEELIRRVPFEVRQEAEWHAVADYLRRSLSDHLGLPLEFLGRRAPDEGDHYTPLVRCPQDLARSLGLRIAGMISCVSPGRDKALRADALFFLFAQGRRVSPPNAEFFSYDFLGLDASPRWADRGWQTSDFVEQWNPYTYERFFCGREAELPGAAATDESEEPGGG